MAQSFSCPNCGATLEYSGSGRTMKCSYCESQATVPEELWQAAESAQKELEVQQTQKKWLKYLWIFLAVTVGLPLCLGLVGTVLGLIGSLIGITVPLVLPHFLK
jgi:hypothetical protein